MKNINSNYWQSRSELLLGNERMEKLQNAHVLVVGLGGVGGFAAEMICRAGVGTMTIADGDVVDITNMNRQLLATTSTIGRAKTEVMAERLRDINPAIKLNAINKFIRDEETDKILQEKYDYVVDAIDTLSPKVNLLAKCVQNNIPVVSSMGSGGKFYPTQIKICDISKSNHCRLAKVVRKRLHRMNIRQGITAVFSPEPINPDTVISYDEDENGNCGSITGTISYMPAIFGCYCASVVIRAI